MKSATATLILIAFVTLAGFGMFAMKGMYGHHHEPGCPFMPGERAICNMTALDHISAWQSMFIAVLPVLTPYLLLVMAVLVVWKYYSPPNRFVRRLPPRRSKEYVPVPFYQELFSSGILNPKAP